MPQPCQFDVMVMENMFGDILSDQGGGILGSIGLMPLLVLGLPRFTLNRLTAVPDIAGQNVATYSMIGSVAMMLEMSFNMHEESRIVWEAMKNVFESGYSTADLEIKRRHNDRLKRRFGDHSSNPLSYFKYLNNPSS